MMTERCLPHNLDAERGVLGAILMDPSALHDVYDIITAQDFYREAHRQIFVTLLELDEVGTSIDFVTIRAALMDKDALESVGGPAYIASLVDGLPIPSAASEYARIVREHAKRRETIVVAQRITEAAYSGDDFRGEALHAAERLSGLTDTSLERPLPLCQVVTEHLATMAHTLESSILTGFDELDRLTMGLVGSELTILASRPSQGKSALALNIALRVAEEQTVALFSLEMSRVAVAVRALAATAQVDGHRLRAGALDLEESARVPRAAATLQTRRLFVDDTPALSVASLRHRALSLRASEGLALVIVDYLQLVRPPKPCDNRVQEVGNISRALKALAKTLKVPVLACAQLSRAAELRKDNRPQLADLRESGDIENDADTVCLLWQPGLYSRNPEDAGRAELIVAKQRNGPIGTIRLRFIRPQIRFVSDTPTLIPLAS